MDVNKILNLCVIFLIGFLCANLLNFYFVYGLENPLSTNFGYFPFSSNQSNSAPFDSIQEKQIQILDDRIIIMINDSSLSRYAQTGSMLPVFDKGANGIRIKPTNVEDIHVGDIVTFKQNNYFIVHRVIEKGEDEQGIYFITKGDNNKINDKKIRFEDIRYLTVGVIW